jgi:ketosteroid isomerase-like protein
MTDELLARNELFERAVLERDREVAAAVLDDDYALVLVQPAPSIMPRDLWIELLPEYVVHEWEVQERTLDVDGDTAAILQRLRMVATVLGEDRSGTLVVSDIWRRRADGWRVWRRHSTPLEAGRMPGGRPLEEAG